jgi:hypothetical protein
LEAKGADANDTAQKVDLIRRTVHHEGEDGAPAQ